MTMTQTRTVHIYDEVQQLFDISICVQEHVDDKVFPHGGNSYTQFAVMSLRTHRIQKVPERREKIGEDVKRCKNLITNYILVAQLVKHPPG